MAVNLGKNQTINLKKSDGGTLRRVRMGLGWDAKVVVKKSLFGGSKQTQKSIDLDASVILLDGSNRVVETVYFGKLRSSDGSVQHTGDNLSGAGDGDDESIIINLGAVPTHVQHLVFTINSYSGESFAEIENAFARLVDSDNNDEELCRYELTGTGNHTAMLMAKVSRAGAGWAFTALGNPGHGRVAQQLEYLAEQACR